jgi:hypothetical protein
LLVVAKPTPGWKAFSFARATVALTSPVVRISSMTRAKRSAATNADANGFHRPFGGHL